MIYRLLDRLAEPELGEPIRIRRRGQLISSDVAHSVRERMKELKPGFPQGVDYLIPFDTTRFVEVSIEAALEEPLANARRHYKPRHGRLL